MAKIVLIACVNKKSAHKTKTRDLYISPLFKMNLKYAESLKPDSVFILSAEYGLVGLDEEIEPYDKTLNNMPSKDIEAWGNSVISKLKKAADLNSDEFILLAGDKYRRFLIPHIKNYKIPLKGLSIGKQLQFLKERVS